MNHKTAALVAYFILLAITWATFIVIAVRVYRNRSRL